MDSRYAEINRNKAIHIVMSVWMRGGGGYNCQCQLKFRPFVSCQLNFRLFVSCQLNGY